MHITQTSRNRRQGVERSSNFQAMHKAQPSGIKKKETLNSNPRCHLRPHLKQNEQSVLASSIKRCFETVKVSSPYQSVYGENVENSWKRILPRILLRTLEFCQFIKDCIKSMVFAFFSSGVRLLFQRY